MIYVDFCKGPKNGLWIGCAEYNNGKYFATGRTLDILMKNIKHGGTRIFRCSAVQFVLSSKQMETGEFEQKYYKFMSTLFRGKYWNNYSSIVKPIQKENKIEEKPVETKQETLPQNKGKYLYEVKDGVLCVYEKKLIAKYEVVEA